MKNEPAGPLLRCNDVSMAYGHNSALDGISFEINPGDYLCIVGENGSGKSTLIKGILGLMPFKNGSVELSDNLKSDGIGYLPQQSEIQKDFPASVGEVVLSGCLGRWFTPFFSGQQHKKAAANMKKLEIENLARKSFRDLSGGQQQRVLLARALCATSALLVLDEPVTGLDPVVTAEFYDICAELNRHDNMTVVMISHDVNAALKYANKILHLNTTVLFFGAPKEYLKSAAGKRFCACGGNHHDI